MQQHWKGPFLDTMNCALRGLTRISAKIRLNMKEITMDGSKKLYALKHSPTLCGTYGGIYTDLQQRVLNTEGEPIEGLYAAGSCALADTIYYEYPGCGYAFGLAIHTGHVAAINALRDLGFQNVQSAIVK